MKLRTIVGLLILIGTLCTELRASDSIVKITAEAESLDLTSPETLPPSGTFWEVMPYGIAAPLPCPPSDPLQPIYAITDGIFLVDSTGGQVSLPFGQSITSSNIATAVEAQGNAIADLIERAQGVEFNRELARAFGMEEPPDFDDTGTNGYTFNSLDSIVPDYGANLWIAQTTVTNNYLTGIGTNTITDIQYEIQSRTNLVQTDWQSEGFILGSATTNWTPLSVPQLGRTNLFIRLRSWADDGSGLPIWWQQQYFGTNGVDPDGNPAGDGWSNWEKFENGWNPNLFYTPREPQNFTATLNSSNPFPVIRWDSANGAVTGYTIARYENFGSGPSASYQVGLTNQFTDTNFPAYTEYDFDVQPSRYTVTANYASGNSSIARADPLANGDNINPNASVFLGSGGVNQLVINHITPDASAIELERTDFTDSSHFDHTNAHIVVAISNFLSGIFPYPTNMLHNGPYGSTYHIQVMWPDGKKSQAINIFPNDPIFYDGRAQLEQNASFLLRAASLTKPFTYYFSDNHEIDQPSAYTYSSYYDIDTSYNLGWSGVGDSQSQNWQRPFIDNYIYRNFLYGDNTNLNSGGFLNNGCSIDGFGDCFLPASPAFNFVAPINGAGIPTLAQSTWAQPYANYSQLGIFTNTSSQFVLPNNIHNYFGLHLLSVLIAHNHGGTLFLDSLSAGNVWPKTSDTYYFYPQFDEPELETVGYYFAPLAHSDTGFYYENPELILNYPLPGNSGFAPSTPQPLLVIGMNGQRTQFAAFAKKIVLNGNTNKPVYVAQYFDKAYKLDGSGNVTSTQTGVLSPWGDFLPTEPGSVALVTMPDINTGQRGTGIVQVVSLALDANHDGVMDLSLFGGDSVSVWSGHGAFSFWLNNGYTKPGINGGLDQDLPVYPNQTGYATTNMQPNSLYGKIRCQRNLENFARLHIAGLPNFPANHGYTVTVGLLANGGAGINLYPACETNGGIGYLTDTNVAAAQLGYNYINGHLTDCGSTLAALGGNNYYGDYTVPLDSSGKPWLTNFLFEGASAGSHYLRLTIFQSNNIIAQATANLNIDDIKSFYEQANVTKVVQTWPEMVQTNLTSGFAIRHSPDYSSYDAKQEAVFVHGWRMTQFDYEKFSDSMFKRLYWQGFQGRFASLRWPTRSADTDVGSLDKFTFNRSEHIAFDSGTGAGLYFLSLRQRFPDYKISAAAHSMGNTVMMEALKELVVAGQAPLDNYVMMQAAVPAHCYDASVSNLPAMLAAETNFPTPNTYANYAAGITNALRGNGKIFNFFNPLDFALATGSNTIGNIPFYGSISFSTSWEANESSVFLKPLLLFGYAYLPTNGVAVVSTNLFTDGFGLTNIQTRLVTDPLELMPFVARPRSKAAGAQSGLGNVVGAELNLQSTLGFSARDYDHSGEFNRNIQDSVAQPFYFQLRTAMFP